MGHNYCNHTGKIWNKFETNLKTYIEATRYVMQVYISKASQKYLNSQLYSLC